MLGIGFWWNYRRKLEFDLLKEYLPELRGKKLLDVACGNGLICGFLKKEGAEVYGVDISPAEIQKANDRGIGEFLVSPAEKLPFQNGFFDCIISNCSVEHFQDDMKAFKEMRRVLKSGGFLAITTESPATNYGEKFNQWRSKACLINQYYTLEDAEKKLVGFKVLKHDYYLSGFSGKMHYWITTTKIFGRQLLTAGSVYHKILFPAYYLLGRQRGGNEKDSFGISFCAIKQ